LFLLSAFLVSADFNCTTYCMKMTTICVGTAQVYFPVYASDGTTVLLDAFSECMAICAIWPKGDPADYGQPANFGDTLACRYNHVNFVNVSDPSSYIHCAHASPIGSSPPMGPSVPALEYCGNRAAFFCDLLFSPSPIVFSNCNENGTYAHYNDCLMEASSWNISYKGGLSDPQVSGNSIECRTAMVAFTLPGAAAPPALNGVNLCEAALWSGGGICGSPCDNWCYDYKTACAGNLTFSSLDDCVTSCDTWSMDTEMTSDKNTVGCRKNWVVKVRSESTGSNEPGWVCRDIGIANSSLCHLASNGGNGSSFVQPMFALVLVLLALLNMA